MSPQEWEAILKEAERAEAAAQQQGKAPIAPEDANEKGLAAARAVVDEFHPKPSSMVDAIGQALRVSSSSIMDPVRAGLSTLTGEENFRNNLALERAETRRAAESVGNVAPDANLTMARDATNIAALTAATPAMAVAGPVSGMATGAVLEAGRQAFETYETTGKLPSIKDEIAAAARGGATAGVGMLLGSGLNLVVNKALGAGRQMPEQLTRYLSKTGKAVELADKKLLEANVQVKAPVVNRMLARIDRLVNKQGFTLGATPKTQAALDALRSRVAQGGDVSLLELNNLRRLIRDYDIGDEAYGGIKTITDQMNRSINGLALTPSAVASGNAKLGVSAWNSLNRNHIQAEKANVLIQMTRQAETLAKENGWSIHRALQKQASKFINRNDITRGKTLNMFSADEQELLQSIAAGNAVGNAMNRLDAKIGHGAVRLGFDYTAGLLPSAAANAAQRNQMQAVVDNIIYGNPVKQGTLAPLVTAPMLGGQMAGPVEGMPQGGPMPPMNLGALMNPQGGESPVNPLLPPSLGQKVQ